MPIRSFKYRCYPTPEQEQHLARTFGSVRFVYNHLLRVRTDAWYERKESIGYAQTDRMLTALKQQPETIWLNEVSSVPLQQTLRHLQTAFVNFWEKRANYPTFKKRDRKQRRSFPRATQKMRRNGNWKGSQISNSCLHKTGEAAFRPSPESANLRRTTRDADSDGAPLKSA
mgnify:CR=1 FL=1